MLYETKQWNDMLSKANCVQLFDRINKIETLINKLLILID